MEASTITEKRLQAECFQWHHNAYPHERGLLFTVDNNATDHVKGNVRKAMGRIKGVSDMLFLYRGKAWCFEFKLPGQKQSPEQKAWQINVVRQNIEYNIVTSQEEFKRLIGQIHEFGITLPF